MLIDQCAARARFAAVFSKLAEPWFNRHAISRTPSLIFASASSNQQSAGVSLPSCRQCQRIRHTSIRPLMVRMLVDCFPLCRFFFPVVALFGGGKSGFRRVDLH
ncbi:MAG: hypothetical protein ABSF26_25125, partial [Thermoguttaceae bacterium]